MTISAIDKAFGQKHAHPVPSATITLTANDGVPLVANLWNKHANTTLLLFTCGGETRNVWRRVVEHLPNEVHALAHRGTDHRGHGDSGRSTIYRFAQFLGECLTRFDGHPSRCA